MDRRTVLAAGAAALGATVAGCSQYGEPKATQAPAPANAVLGKTTDIPVGGGKIFAPQQVVVTQPTQGTFKAFTSICTHQQCPVASVADGTINCDCHGSKYAVADGSVVNGPAPKPLAPKQITVSGDSITLT